MRAELFKKEHRIFERKKAYNDRPDPHYFKPNLRGKIEFLAGSPKKVCLQEKRWWGWKTIDSTPISDLERCWFSGEVIGWQNWMNKLNNIH